MRKSIGDLYPQPLSQTRYQREQGQAICGAPHKLCFPNKNKCCHGFKLLNVKVLYDDYFTITE